MKMYCSKEVLIQRWMDRYARLHGRMQKLSPRTKAYKELEAKAIATYMCVVDLEMWQGPQKEKKKRGVKK